MVVDDGRDLSLSQSELRTSRAPRRLELVPEASDAGHDPPLVWDAMCQLERKRQERCDALGARHRRLYAELIGAE